MPIFMHAVNWEWLDRCDETEKKDLVNQNKKFWEKMRLLHFFLFSKQKLFFSETQSSKRKTFEASACSQLFGE